MQDRNQYFQHVEKSVPDLHDQNRAKRSEIDVKSVQNRSIFDQFPIILNHIETGDRSSVTEALLRKMFPTMMFIFQHVQIYLYS